MSVWKQYACLIGSEDIVTDPPEKVLGLMVLGGVAYVSVQPLGDMEALGPEEYHFKLPARSLLHILQSAIAADEDPELAGTLRHLVEDFRGRLTPEGKSERPQR